MKAGTLEIDLITSVARLQKEVTRVSKVRLLVSLPVPPWGHTA